MFRDRKREAVNAKDQIAEKFIGDDTMCAVATIFDCFSTENECIPVGAYEFSTSVKEIATKRLLPGFQQPPRKHAPIRKKKKKTPENLASLSASFGPYPVESWDCFLLPSLEQLPLREVVGAAFG